MTPRQRAELNPLDQLLDRAISQTDDAKVRDWLTALRERGEYASGTVAKENKERKEEYTTRTMVKCAREGCAVSFEPKKINQKYCSKRCSVAVGNHRYREANPEKVREKARRRHQAERRLDRILQLTALQLQLEEEQACPQPTEPT